MFFLAHLRQPVDVNRLQPFGLTYLNTADPPIAAGYGGPFCQLQRHSSGILIIEGSASYKAGMGKDAVSFVEWNGNSRRIKLSRGLASGHALYMVVRASGEFVIATHVRLLQALGHELREDESVLGEYMMYRHITPPRTMFAGVQSLPLGATAHIEIDVPSRVLLNDSIVCSFGGAGREEPANQRAARFVNHLRDAYATIAEPTSTTFLLSGGIDSSILYAVGSRELHVQRSYSTSYPFEEDRTDRERQYAETAGRALNAHHTHVRWTTSEYLHGLIDATAAAEVPVHHLQSVLLYLLFSQGMQSRETLVVSGEAADTVFGTTFQRRLWRAARRRWLWSFLEREPILSAVGAAAKLSRSGSGVLWILQHRHDLERDMRDPQHPIWQTSRYGSASWVHRYFGLSEGAIVQGRMDVLEQFRSRPVVEATALFSILAEIAATTSIWNSLAVAAGKQLMFPFLTPEFVRDGFDIPLHEKFKQRKKLALDIGGHLNIPAFILSRPKSGFGIDPGRWAPPGAAFEPLLRLAYPIFPESVLRQLQSADYDTGMSLWNCLCYAIWKRMWIQNESAATLHEELQAGITDSVMRPKDRSR